MRVFFGAVESPQVAYSETGPRPDTVVCTVPARRAGGPELVPVRVVNPDSQGSNTLPFTYVLPAPTITALTPPSRLAGETVEISGSGFRDGLRVFFGAVESPQVTYSETGPRPDTVLATVPQRPAGGPEFVPVRVVNPDSQGSSTLLFTYRHPAPSITSITPAEASTGAEVEIVGPGLRNGLRVFFGAAESQLVVFSETGPRPHAAIAVVPPGEGMVSVHVVNRDAQDSNRLTFTYETVVEPPPTVTALSPSMALAAESVEITGSEFRDGLRVYFGAVEALQVTYSEAGPRPDTVIATVPPAVPGRPGSVGVRVVNPDGQASGELDFTYLFGAPIIAGIAPSSQLAGRDVEITGGGFRDGLRVFFGRIEAREIAYSETGPRPDTVLATVPSPAPGGSGSVGVRVVNLEGQASNELDFTYLHDAPLISSLEPAAARVGDTVAILGENFRDGLRVFFGVAESLQLTFSETGPQPGRVEAEAPAGQGVVSVRVLNADGQESNGAPFTYVAPPSDFVRGDANRDGRLDIADAVTVLLFLFSGLSIDCPDAADSDDSGDIVITDPIRILNYLFLGGAPPPPPFPEAGEDPSEDGLDCTL